MAFAASVYSAAFFIDCMRNSNGGFYKIIGGKQEGQDQVDPDDAIVFYTERILQNYKNNYKHSPKIFTYFYNIIPLLSLFLTLIPKGTFFSKIMALAQFLAQKSHQFNKKQKQPLLKTERTQLKIDLNNFKNPFYFLLQLSNLNSIRTMSNFLQNKRERRQFNSKRIKQYLNIYNQYIMQQYKILKIIGQGAFGNAYLARQIQEDKDYVIKKVELTDKTTQQTENIFIQVKLLQAFKHANIVSYRQSIIEGQELNIIMEFCAGGDLNQLIVEQKENQGGKKLQQSQIIDWATQIALAIFYMHDKRILHRDLKTPNIFITDDRVKLGDFGISKVLDQKVDLASTSIGTPYYMSPEQYRHKPYSYKSDIWAFGCIIYEMCNQKRPFEAYSLNGLAVKVLQANFSPISQFYSKQLRELVKKMLQKKEKDRPSILQFLQSPIIRKRTYSYLKQVYEKLIAENGDKVLIEGVLYQAKKLGISLSDKIQQVTKKTKPEFSAEKKKQEKQRIRQQLQDELKRIGQKAKKQKEELKRLQQNRKNNLKANSHRSTSTSSKKHSQSTNTASYKSLKEYPSVVQVQKNGGENKVGRAKYFKMQEQYDFYDMEYEEEDSEEQDKIQAIAQDDQEDQKHDKETKSTNVKPYQKEKYSKPTQDQKKSQKSKFTQLSNPPNLLQNDIPIQEAIISLKQSVKVNNQKLNTIKNQLSNIDFQISSSEDELQKTIGRPQQIAIMKKKDKNPSHVIITDKINDLRQTILLLLNQDNINKLLQLSRSKKGNPTRTEIEKISGSNLGVFHLANQIAKLQTLLERVPLYQ